MYEMYQEESTNWAVWRDGLTISKLIVLKNSNNRVCNHPAQADPWVSQLAALSGTCGGSRGAALSHRQEKRTAGAIWSRGDCKRERGIVNYETVSYLVIAATAQNK